MAKRLFGKKKDTGPPPPSLQETSESMGKRLDHVEVKIAAEDKKLQEYKRKIAAAKNPATKKNLQRQAIDILKRKKMYEGQRDQLANQHFNVDQMAFGIENAKNNIDVISTMKQSVATTQSLLKQQKIDDVYDLVDDLADINLDMEEINAALGANYATPDITTEDLEAELDMLGDELEEEFELDATPSYLLPAQPTTAPNKNATASSQQTELDALANL